MNHNKILLLFLLIALCGCEKEYTSPNEVERFEIKSSFTGFLYEISVLYPQGYEYDETCHIVYLLDGQAYFDEASEVVDRRSDDRVILISIGYSGENKRATDCTFPKDDSSDDKNTGGGDRFLQFFNDELIPHIENVLEIKSKERTIYGHSFGGYFCLYAMLQQELDVPFDNFIVASAPVDFAENYLIKKEQEFYEKNEDLDYKLHISYGSLEANATFMSFVKKIEKHTYPSLDYKQELYKYLGHQNTPIKAFENGLNFILR